MEAFLRHHMWCKNFSFHLVRKKNQEKPERRIAREWFLTRQLLSTFFLSKRVRQASHKKGGDRLEVAWHVLKLSSMRSNYKQSKLAFLCLASCVFAVIKFVSMVWPFDCFLQSIKPKCRKSLIISSFGNLVGLDLFAACLIASPTSEHFGAGWS